MSIKIGILGYGNLGRGVECAVEANSDMELVAVFTRRDPASVKIATAGVPVVNVKEAPDWQDKIDVLIICGGSATDLPKQTPEFIKYFNVIDSFDTHARIPEHFENVDKAGKESGHLGIISVGWDPGLFSLARVYGNAILPGGHDYTFWGRGVSQGHSDAIRRVEGVADARQYTVPVESALSAVRSGKNPELRQQWNDVEGMAGGHLREIAWLSAYVLDPELIDRLYTARRIGQKNEVTVAEDKESVSVRDSYGVATGYRHVHGWTHDDPALLYSNTEISVYFYDSDATYAGVSYSGAIGSCFGSSQMCVSALLVPRKISAK